MGGFRVGGRDGGFVEDAGYGGGGRDGAVGGSVWKRVDAAVQRFVGHRGRGRGLLSALLLGCFAGLSREALGGLELRLEGAEGAFGGHGSWSGRGGKNEADQGVGVGKKEVAGIVLAGE